MPAIAASIALAPFENLSGDPSQDVLALGFVEDVGSALSRFGAIEVMYPQAFAAASPGRSGSDPTAVASNRLRGSVRRAGGWKRPQLGRCRCVLAMPPRT